ncbi:MAG: TetR/AcrR family transcriptional regulator [Pseudomonadaceae bacterium]|nr:TetR/AcrR family transcriptional regulator [Pseudomonadaceae bacterium]
MPSNAATKPDAYHHGSLRQALLSRAAEVIGEFGIESLTLRGLARDLGVSHAAPNRHFRSREDLLTALATLAWTQATDATLARALAAEGDPWIQLNAMGRGYLSWALSNPALFAVVTHPDINRYADEELRNSIATFQKTIADAVDQTQADGRHPAVDPTVLKLYTNAVPFGAAMLLTDPVLSADMTIADQEQFVADILELVVPIKDRNA